ncbi:hypothetical protein B0H17DRAFT_1139161 [Mycena rosella]|uniref:Uncharacterized protein n=1 Tax=Mycena rosella TaxID=1033263 RepID=A0AAD7D4X5_MYCRO|nr:hypothetical protein B0H17DRAFT_1139161 [Mycena rosella]
MSEPEIRAKSTVVAVPKIYSLKRVLEQQIFGSSTGVCRSNRRYKDWPAAAAKAHAGDRFASELPSDTETKTKSKVYRRRGKENGKANAQFVSSDFPESKEPVFWGDSLEDSRHCDVEYIAKKESGLSKADPVVVALALRRSSWRKQLIISRLKRILTEEVELQVADSPSRHHDLFCGPDQSELDFESDLSTIVGEENLDGNREEWEVGAEDWQNVKDEESSMESLQTFGNSYIQCL